mmetsp:Transcript_12970/g.26920  ORF Transcript_12970/g.26920 Transcript_12970/m.26920 type:complete len:95 (+) Transcript_12970:1547-1831(+)
MRRKKIQCESQRDGRFRVNLLRLTCLAISTILKHNHPVVSTVSPWTPACTKQDLPMHLNPQKHLEEEKAQEATLIIIDDTTFFSPPSSALYISA